jgi:undecaprenyl-phosphate 4-deoxy-4-formamido-L-arabinose transferase
MPSDKYSVIIPVFNSARSLPELFEKIRDYFQKTGRDYEVIAVDDCSADESWKVLCDIREKNPEKTIIIQLTENFGQHNATFCGFSYTSGNWIITIDDDLQHDPGDIELMIQAAKEEN